MTASTTDSLLKKGVSLTAPETVEFDQAFNPDRVLGKNVTIHAGCKLFGDKSLICQGAELGFESPVTIKDCYIGPNVKLQGGYFENAVFLEGAKAGSGSHIRTGTILEEQASIAHTVGLKQTVLFPFVTLGSLINFCDCLMAGGTDRKNHSEVGSAYIHFNFTPNQDKATPSLMGDVPRGVMLNQSPIFLGGQGGLVGPCRIAYGTVISAGSICRKDQLIENQLVIAGNPRGGRIPFQSAAYRNVGRLIRNNFYYIANLFALRQWYHQVRSLFVGPQFPQPLYIGLTDILETGIRERLVQLSRLREKMQDSKAGNEIIKAFCVHWPEIESILQNTVTIGGEPETKERFLQIIDQKVRNANTTYLAVIKSLDNSQAAVGTDWLGSIVSGILDRIQPLLPSLDEG